PVLDRKHYGAAVFPRRPSPRASPRGLLAPAPLKSPRAGGAGKSRRDDQDHRRTHSPVAAAPGVAHFAPSVAPLAQTKPARTSSSPQRTLSVPVTTRIAGAGPGSPFGPSGPAGPARPAGPCGP